MDTLLRVYAIIWKELLQLSRDRLTFGMVVGIPLIQLMLFGYAINNDVRHLKAAVANQAGTQLSRAFLADLQATQVLDIYQNVDTPAELKLLLDKGEVGVGIFLPKDFDRRVLDKDRPVGQLLIDATDPTIVGVVSALKSMPVHFDSQRQESRANSLEMRPYYNPERRSAINIVPGLIGVILTMTMLMFTAVAIVREREQGNIELLITTPIKTTELMIGKIVPYILIGLLQVTLVVVVGYLLFDVPVVGSLVQLYTAAFLFISANLAMGLFVSTLVTNQFQAMQASVFILLPSIFLSGFMFPFEGMPEAAKMIAQLFPLTHFIKLVRGIMLKGVELSQLLDALIPLLFFIVLTMFAAVTRFSKRLD